MSPRCKQAGLRALRGRVEMEERDVMRELERQAFHLRRK